VIVVTSKAVLFLITTLVKNIYVRNLKVRLARGVKVTILPEDQRIFTGVEHHIEDILLQVDYKALAKVKDPDLSYFNTNFMRVVVKHKRANKFLVLMSERFKLPDEMRQRTLEYACQEDNPFLVSQLINMLDVDPSVKLLDKFNLRLLIEYCTGDLDGYFNRAEALRRGSILMMLDLMRNLPTNKECC